MANSSIDVRSILRRLNIDGRIIGQEFWASCPSRKHQDKRPSWHININPAHPKYGVHWCFGCGFGGNIYQLIKYMKQYSNGEAKVFAESFTSIGNTKQKSKKSKQELKLVPVHLAPKKAVDYLAGRGVSLDNASNHGLLWCNHGELRDRIVFEVWPEGWTGRAISSKMMTHKHTAGTRGVVSFGGLSEALVIVEGPFDALKCALAEYRSMALLTKNWSQKTLFKRGKREYIERYLQAFKINKVIRALDPDAKVEDEKLGWFLNSLGVESEKAEVYPDAGAMCVGELKEMLDGISEKLGAIYGEVCSKSY